ncbi:ABC transporter permease [Roseiconus lacunae]|uniref:ABC transporter permease n=1 Tax=Roseiconus lacunae TaxID=2605694 RepID=A0ABT7PED0_9BACT|nr:ABC transporter permease [Roseiconus lacunae]MCD0462860.1 ABC transporter permease [Roseiconus lacunae]MDM4014852.1 ABC transporter permease [Roseiconus lacunae]WRQ50442.1 ABC transporter permease [Stieleria sp. HD01]
MYIFENPVLQRELLVNLRTKRAFVLLALYQLLLAAVVIAAWPSDERLDLTSSPPSATKLVNLFFLGQYVIASLMAPSFAAGTIAGEKERKTYEMLLASPMRPGAIVLGKMVASLTHLGMLIIGSLPIIVLCLPLGGVHVYEVLAAYLGLIISVILFGAIGVMCSSYFPRTSSALVVSYLVILPLVIGACVFWATLGTEGYLRLKLATVVVPAFGLTAVILMGAAAAGRMLYPPDVGSEGKEVIDLEKEAEEAVGLVIQPDQFPDRLFAPPKKNEMMADGANPVYDKELHSEIFSQGTLMLRLVIQISILLAIPMMGYFLFFQQHQAPWFCVYVIVFNMLVGPSFLAGSITSERERQTLDLLLTTPLSPLQILWGKFVVRFRISIVLTGFLLWPLILGASLNTAFWSNLITVALMFLIVATVCLVNCVVALTCSMFARKTSIALLTTYALLLLLYVVPPALSIVARMLDMPPSTVANVDWTGIASPFSALFWLPLNEDLVPNNQQINDGFMIGVIGYFAFSIIFVIVATAAMLLRLRGRKGLSDG